MRAIWFHGCGRSAANRINADGFRIGDHFATRLDDALRWGSHIFEVALNMPADAMRKTIARSVPPSAIVSYTVYMFERIVDHKQLRYEIEQENKSSTEEREHVRLDD